MKEIGVYIDSTRGWQHEIEFSLRFLLNAAGVSYTIVTDPRALRQYRRVLIYGEVERDSFATLSNHITLFIPCLIQSEDLYHVSTCYREKPVDIYGPFVQYGVLPGYPYSYRDGGCPVKIQLTGASTYIKLGWDLVGATFHLLNLSRERSNAGKSETEPPQPDNCRQEPTVDRYILHLEELLDLYHPEVERIKRWQGDSRFAVALTHDVDMLQKWRWHTRLKWLAKLPYRAWGNREQLRRDWVEMRSALDPWDNCNEVLELEKQYGFNSTWFFLTEARDHQTWRYNIKGPRAQAAVQAVREHGGEVALHGGYRQPHALSRFLEQKQRLEQVLGRELQGVRQHWLKYSLAVTPDAQARAGLSYDSTLGWNHAAGYRCGTSLPYPLYDPLLKQETGIYEIPLVFMDTALFLQQELSPAEVSDQLSRLLDRTEKVGGLLTVLFHNHYFCEADFPGWRETYTRFLNEVKERSAWVETLRNIYRRWHRRNRLINGEGG
ncbi:MAG: polysaccharide deacetylase family protein [Candidatus Delongbacteria bacterium]|nr:polysaccharide deacetylase family protein [Candidatus Delongbacteria bacterium]